MQQKHILLGYVGKGSGQAKQAFFTALSSLCKALIEGFVHPTRCLMKIMILGLEGQEEYC